MSNNFDAGKHDILTSIKNGSDNSPKGSIDLHIQEIVEFINNLDDFVTTSSCSGRISLYRDDNQTKGIKWLLVEHATVTSMQVKECILKSGGNSGTDNVLTVLKCEAFILHISCRNVEAAKDFLQLAMECGFRESGLVISRNLNKKVMLAVRTTAFGLELPVAIGSRALLDDIALDVIVQEANKRLVCNFARADRLLSSLKVRHSWPYLTLNEWSANNMADNESNILERWGHVCVPLNSSGLDPSKNSVVIVVGGYGINPYSDQPSKSQRSLPVLHQNYSIHDNECTSTSTVAEVNCGDHASTSSHITDNMHATGTACLKDQSLDDKVVYF